MLAPHSLAVCYPVRGRPDLFRSSLASLERQLGKLDATIWIFDNGSDQETRRLIETMDCKNFRLFKVFLPENMGIPYVANIFYQMVTQSCAYADHRAPTHVMLADADAYFKKPVEDMLHVLETNYRAAIISGHDSIEHPALSEWACAIKNEPVTVKVKESERGLCLIMRTEILGACVPFPHHRNRDVDWELTKWHPNSIAARSRTLLAVDYVAHLGIYDSTWSSEAVPTDPAETAEIHGILEQEGLLSGNRRARMEEHRRAELEHASTIGEIKSHD